MDNLLYIYGIIPEQHQDPDLIYRPYQFKDNVILLYIDKDVAKDMKEEVFDSIVDDLNAKHPEKIFVFKIEQMYRIVPSDPKRDNSKFLAQIEKEFKYIESRLNITYLI